MAYLVHHKNKKTGVVYVFSAESYWDKEKKAPRNRQVCLGKLDPKTGEIIPTQRKRKIVERAVAADATATTKVIGPSVILSKVAKETGLAALLKRCFPGEQADILSLLYFIVQRGLPLSRCESWSLSHRHPAGQPIASQRISELLQTMKEDDRQRFHSLWLKKVIEHDCLCYDLTSISSYAKGNEYIRYGYNRDGEKLPQLNLALIFGQKSGLPAYYRRMPGNITDVATLHNTLDSLDFLGRQPVHVVLDRGFYSQANVDELLEGRHHFTMAVPSRRKWVQTYIDEHIDRIALPQNYHKLDGADPLFAVSVLHKWGPKRRRTYLHLYYNARQAAVEFDQFTSDLLKYKEEIESDKRVVAHEEYYERFFFVKRTPKRGLSVKYNDEAILKHRNRYAGFFCVLSTVFKDPMDALRTYRQKDVIENSFDDLKNQMDMKRLRVHSSAAMDTRIFLQFLALILLSQIRQIAQAHQATQKLSVRELMEHMESITQITYSGRYGSVITETNPIQREILKAFGIEKLT